MMTGSEWAELAGIVHWIDNDLDSKAHPDYQEQPLAQDWARVAKAGEELGEAIDALIGLTGQNPRKGIYGDMEDLLNELADLSLTGLYAIQHFTKDIDDTMDVLIDRARRHRGRRQAQLDHPSSAAFDVKDANRLLGALQPLVRQAQEQQQEPECPECGDTGYITLGDKDHEERLPCIRCSEEGRL